MSSKYAIFTQNLTKYYGDFLAINKLSIKIPYNKIFGLLGPNGAGKTTFIRILNCILPPTSGSADVAGYDILKERLNVKKKCGLVPENPGLYQKLTSREFLILIGELYNIPRITLDRRIEELIEIFELQDKVHVSMENYSQGMKQKVSICAALIHDPDIIFLDEPTSNLDPAAARNVKNLILESVKKAHKTIFLCTHLLDVAEELCDEIAIINKGEIQIIGTMEEIIKNLDCKSLEECYLKIIGESKIGDYLSWRR
jgi:ABC-2 type transport system ATP-binding protein